MISMVILFVYRLIQVYKTEHDNEILIGAITKITILVSISVSVTMVDLVTTTLYRYVAHSILLQWIFSYVALFDVYTNFICVIMCYKMFKKYYQNVCSCMDIKCRICWNKLIANKRDTNLADMLDNHTKNQQLSVQISSTKSSSTKEKNVKE